MCDPVLCWRMSMGMLTYRNSLCHHFCYRLWVYSAYFFKLSWVSWPLSQDVLMIRVLALFHHGEIPIIILFPCCAEAKETFLEKKLTTLLMILFVLEVIGKTSLSAIMVHDEGCALYNFSKLEAWTNTYPRTQWVSHFYPRVLPIARFQLKWRRTSFISAGPSETHFNQWRC